MEGHLNYPPCSSMENMVLDVKPLRSLAPMFPTPLGLNTFSVPGIRPFVCVSPFGQHPSPSVFDSGQPFGFAPSFPIHVPTDLPNPRPEDPVPRPDNNGVPVNGDFTEAHQRAAASFSSPLRASSAPVSPFQTPPLAIVPLDEADSPARGGTTSTSGRKIKQPLHLSSYSMGDTDTDGSGRKKVAKRKKRPKKVYENNQALIPAHEDPRESVEVVLMTFDALRRRLLQLDEAANINRRPDLKASGILMSSDLRANMAKQIGAVPGIEVGDIFYFRIEMCLVGLHAPIMGGIDYMTVRFDDGEDPIAISIVSAGGYENEEDDADVLIYSGQGGGLGNKTEKKQADDQKLERGNLALERSLHRGNLIRVVRGAKDLTALNGKIYIYDGLYKIQTSWTEKTKLGFSVFKYKLLREPGQPDGIAIWKMTRKWIENPSSRGRVILPDMSSGVETIPVCLVNDVDDERGPSHFKYVTTVKYSRPINSVKSVQGCMCLSVCLPGDANCSCAQQNGGDLPYSSTGSLVRRRSLIYECNASCQCSINCRNRVTQKGVKFHFEVFRTRDRGWGLRSWEPIRAGTFICEYTGEITDENEASDDVEEDDYMFQTASADEKTFKWNFGPELLGESNFNNSTEATEPLSFIISAKNAGNISRFMNHSCSPNVFWQPVQHGHGDEGYPHIMFFATKHIPPMTELTYDYGLNGAESDTATIPRRAKKCLCGSSKCRQLFG